MYFSLVLCIINSLSQINDMQDIKSVRHCSKRMKERVELHCKKILILTARQLNKTFLDQFKPFPSTLLSIQCIQYDIIEENFQPILWMYFEIVESDFGLKIVDGLCTSIEWRFLKFYWMNILENSLTAFFFVFILSVSTVPQKPGVWVSAAGEIRMRNENCT